MPRFTSPNALISVSGLVAATLVSLYWLASSESAFSEPAAITIRSSPIAWDPENPGDTQAGQLTYIGGLELTSDHPDFGGLSGLIVGQDGVTLIAVTDQGNWVTANIISEGGRPINLSDARIEPITDIRGESLSGKRNTDAEGLAILGTDPRTTPILVSFERRHRLRYYKLTDHGFEASAWPIRDFEFFDTLENNGGLEAITFLRGGAVLAMSEKTFNEDGHIVGARLIFSEATPVYLEQHEPYVLTDIDVLPNGDLITLERHYSPLAGVSMMMRRIPAIALESREPLLYGEILLEANNSRSIDNMEGLSVRQDKEGRTLLYLVSDDNFNPLQRTLLLVFALDE